MIKLEVQSHSFSESFTYEMGSVIRNQEDIFYSIEIFQKYIDDLQKVADFYSNYKLSIKTNE